MFLFRNLFVIFENLSLELVRSKKVRNDKSGVFLSGVFMKRLEKVVFYRG